VDNLKQRNGDAGAEDSGPVTRSGQPMKFEVKHFRMTNGRIRLGTGAAAIVLPMPTIEFSDLGTAEGGITANQLALAVMRSAATGVVETTTHAAVKVGSTMGAAAGDAVQKLGDKLKSLFDKGN
jgi:hypothetical protein